MSKLNTPGEKSCTHTQRKLTGMPARGDVGQDEKMGRCSSERACPMPRMREIDHRSTSFLVQLDLLERINFFPERRGGTATLHKNPLGPAASLLRPSLGLHAGRPMARGARRRKSPPSRAKKGRPTWTDAARNCVCVCVLEVALKLLTISGARQKSARPGQPS